MTMPSDASRSLRLDHFDLDGALRETFERQSGETRSGFLRRAAGAGAVAVGWGPTPGYEAAKALARAGDAGAGPALVECCGRALDQRL